MELEERRKLPIGFMDSGLGGLSVLSAAREILPKENYIFFGDSANAPYGTKERARIRELAFNVAENLIGRGIKALVVACNTATSAAVKDLRAAYPDLIVIGIEPAVKPAAAFSRGGRVLVLATPATLRLEKFFSLVKRFKDRAEIVPVPCDGLMEFVEAGQTGEEVLFEYFKEHVEPYLTENTESIVLGCTHYPFIRKQLRDFVNRDGIRIIDGSLGTSRQLERCLKKADLLNPGPMEGSLTILNSKPGREMIERSYQLLGLPCGVTFEEDTPGGPGFTDQNIDTERM